MNNTAEVHSDDNSVHFISTVNPKRYAKTMIAIIGIVVLLLYISVVAYTVSDKMSGAQIIGMFVFAPTALSLTLGKYVFWNLYGEEEVILSAEGLNYRRSYGIFTTKWHIKSYQPLYYQIIHRRTDLDLSTIRIGSKTVMNVPITIFTSTVLVPTASLQEMVHRYEQLVNIKMGPIDDKSVQA